MDRITQNQARSAVRLALETGTSPGGLPAAQMLERGSIKLYFYEPFREDHQTPHEQDEVYVVLAGSGTFASGRSEDALERVPFGPGDALYTAAGTVHRFEDFTDDFETWVIMYGPEGGERLDR